MAERRSKLVKCLNCLQKYPFIYYPKQMSEPLKQRELRNMERLAFVFVDPCQRCGEISQLQIIEA